MNAQQFTSAGQATIYDADRLPPPESGLFDPEALRRRGEWVGAPAGGRGSACFLVVEGIPAVLRSYRRGGLFAPLFGDRYLRGPLAATRPWREWRLLARLHHDGLPVPAPLAARVVRSGPFYRAEIVVERLAAQTLAERLGEQPLEVQQWRAIGIAIGRLHRYGVDHADLNAHNLLLGGDGEVTVIDFDRARLRRPRRGWQRRNLRRLQRSLRKLAGQVAGFHAPDYPAMAALFAGWAVGNNPPGPRGVG